MPSRRTSRRCCRGPSTRCLYGGRGEEWAPPVRLDLGRRHLPERCLNFSEGCLFRSVVERGVLEAELGRRELRGREPSDGYEPTARAAASSTVTVASTKRTITVRRARPEVTRQMPAARQRLIHIFLYTCCCFRAAQLIHIVRVLAMLRSVARRRHHGQSGVIDGARVFVCFLKLCWLTKAHCGRSLVGPTVTVRRHSPYAHWQSPPNRCRW